MYDGRAATHSAEQASGSQAGSLQPEVVKTWNLAKYPRIDSPQGPDLN